MSDDFQPPSFVEGSLELRYENGEVCVYGTPDGLLRLADLCKQLADQAKPRRSKHIHLEDYQFLTIRSLPGTVAVFSQ